MSDRQWYEEYQQELAAERQTKEDIIAKGEYVGRDEEGDPVYKKPEHVFDPATAPKQGHIWIDRGLVLSCENAGHSYHQAWKRLPMS